MYNFKASQLKRTIAIKDLVGISKNLQKGSSEFVIHVDNERDYRVTSKQREELINTLKLAFVSIKHENLKIFGLHKLKNL